MGWPTGAGFGAALSLVVLGRGFPPQVAAFAFALLAVAAVLAIAGRSESSVVPLLLTGVVVSAFFQALLSLVVYFASPYALQTLFFWLMGNPKVVAVSGATYTKFGNRDEGLATSLADSGAGPSLSTGINDLVASERVLVAVGWEEPGPVPGLAGRRPACCWTACWRSNCGR